MMGWYDGNDGASWVWMGLMMIVVWVVVIAVGVLLFRLTERGSSSGSPTPQQLIDERLARGEVDLEEYQAISQALRGSSREGRRSSTGVGGGRT